MNKLIKYIFLLFTMTLLITCNQRKSQNNELNIDSFPDHELPIVNGGRIIFILKDKIIYQLKLRDIDRIYFKPYNREYDQDIFLNEYVYSNKLLSEDLIKNSYNHSNVDEKFLKQYEQTNINILKNKFCIDTGYKTYIKNELDYDTEITLCYIFFKNGFNIGYDDVEGIFVFEN